MITLTVELSGGRTAEVASIGREGAVGGIVSCGHAPAFSRADVLVPGPAFRVPMEALEDAKSRSHFIRNLFCRYSDYLLAQVMQAVGLQRVSIPSRTRRALAAPCPGSRRRPDRTHAGSICSPARRSANDRQCSRSGTVVRRADVNRTRQRARDRSGRSQAPFVRMLSAPAGAL